MSKSSRRRTSRRSTTPWRGSIYGLSSNSRRTAFLRPPNRAPGLDNLYFVGGSVHPGGGIPLVLLSARLVTRMITGKKH